MAPSHEGTVVLYLIAVLLLSSIAHLGRADGANQAVRTQHRQTADRRLKWTRL